MVAVGKMSSLKMVMSHNSCCRKNVMSHNGHLSTLTLLQVHMVAKKMFLKRQMVVNEFFIKCLLPKSSHSQIKNVANWSESTLV